MDTPAAINRRQALQALAAGLTALLAPQAAWAGVATPLQGWNRLGMQVLIKAMEGENSGQGAGVMVSPLSLGVALLSLASGSAGSTEAMFRKALDITDRRTADAQRDTGRLLHSLVTQKSVTLRSANGVWLSKSNKLVTSFAQAQRAAFQSEVETRDFADPHTLAGINRWFAQKTQNLIPQMLSELSAKTEIVLANALYFKGRWQDTFDRGQTKPGSFQVGGSQALSVPMMRRSAEAMAYQDSDRMQAVRLPFAGRAFEMIVVLPRPGVSVVDLVKNAEFALLLEGEPWRKRPGELVLPRLKIESGGNLRAPLEAVGLRGMFEGADFSRMTHRPVQVDQVVQRTALSWDENGAEAAAATAAIATRAMQQPEPFRMTVDRPFLLALRHEPTRALLMAGLVNDPGVRAE